MKIDMTIDCSEWYTDEDGENFGELLKYEVVSNLTAQLAEKLYNRLNINDKGSLQSQLDESEKQLSKLIKKRTDEMQVALEEKVDSILASFIKGEYVKTDSYGKIRGTTTLEEVLKEKFKDYLNGTVDKDGKPSSYHGCIPRIGYLVDKISEPILEKHATELIKAKIVKELSDITS